MKNLIVLLLIVILSGCGTKAKTIGNKETHFMEPAKCGSIGTVERDGTCFQSVIISSKSDARVKMEKRPDGTIIYDVDNVGAPGFFHDIATTFNSMLLNRAINGD
ncbi:hypothetical protein KAR91_56495 [Candidatus Pacearchaeota archaeon]|nr:hypothetical protein [Candidatus Pacearchaeota archaeon]